MSLLQEKMRAAELARRQAGSEIAKSGPPPARNRHAREILMRRWQPRPFQVVSVTSNKGGVGKTTLATNLAIFARALCEDLPILVLGLDDQSLLDRLFAFPGDAVGQTVASGLRAGSFADAIRLGQYGVHYVPSDPGIAELKRRLDDPLCLHRALERTGWKGLVILDTKSDLEILTQSAVATSDLCLVPVCDHVSLQESRKLFGLLDTWCLPRDRARIVLSMLDLRIKYRGAQEPDLLALLLSEIRRLGFPRLETFVSASPKVRSLTTNPEGAVHSILSGAPSSLVHRQMRLLARELLGCLGLPVANRKPAGRPSRSTPHAKRLLLSRRAS